MANNTFETELLIKAGVKGLESISKLGSEIESAGLDISELTEKGQHLNQTFNEIEQKQGLINHFREQKKAVSEAANEWQNAQEQTKALANEWQTAKSRANELKIALDEQGEATKEQKAEYRDAVKEVERLAKAHEQSVKQAGRLKDQHSELNTSLNTTRQAMADLELSTTNLATQEQFLQEQSLAAGEALNELNAEAENLSEIAQAKILLGIETDDAALQQIEAITSAYETLKASGQLTSSELARASELATEQIEELEASLSNASDESTDFATELGKVTAAAGGLAVVTAAAMEFEAAMAGVKKTVDGSPEQIQALSGEIKQLSIDLGLSSEAVAEIAAQGGQLGIPIEELGRFTEMAGKMSVAFGISAEEAAESAAQLANVFGISMQSVEALGDAINTLGNNTAAKEPDIINAMVRIGGTAKQFGLAEEQAASLAAAFIALGKPPEVAATAINGLLTKLQTAQVQGAGFQEALDGIGLSADQLADDINANPQEALLNFLQTLSKLDDQQRSIATFKLFGQEYADDVNLLIGSLDTYNQTLDLTQDKSATIGAMQSEFEAQMSTSAAQTARAEAAIMALTQTLGQHLLPIVSTTASGIASVANAINDFANNFPMMTKLVVLVAGARVAMVAFNSTMALAGTIGLTAGTNISTGMATARTSILGTTAATNGLASKMSRLGTLFAAAASWTIGTAIGDSFYENSSAARAFGDELARGLAYLDAMITDRTFDDVRNNFETSAESARRLAEAQKSAVQTTDELADAENEAANAAKLQADENRQLVNDIIATEATVKILNRELINLAANGQKNSQEYNQLATELDETKLRLEAMHLEAKQNNLGELLKSDLDKASDAFETLGLDAQEFATGMNSEVTQSLEAFSVVAELAEDDTAKLARAYNAAKESAGQTAQAQAGLEQALLAATNGNKQLADEVKRTATEQRNAKNASDEQAAALDKLGISMDAANQSMSASGLDMIATLKSGVTAIKDQATSADALKTALTQALDVSVAAAQTKADFAAISQTLKEAGIASQVTAEQNKILQAGMQGGAAAAKVATDAISEQTTALADNANVANQNSVASAANADAKDKQAQSAEQAADAEAKVAQATDNTTTSYKQMIPVAQAAIANQINGLQQMGATAEQTDQVMRNLMQGIEGRRYMDFGGLLRDFHNLSESINEKISIFTHARDAAIGMTQALGGAAVTSNELARAQNILKSATTASIDGIVKMDSQTLNNLKNAIDGARQRMQGLADDARNTADNLAASLAKLKGNDDKAREIEQTSKLTALQDKLNEARQRGNADEVKQLERALELQKQINAEEDKKARQQQEETRQREQQTQKVTTPTPAPKSESTSVPTQPAYIPSARQNPTPINIGKVPTPAEVVDAFDERIEALATASVMNKLIEEAKRRPI